MTTAAEDPIERERNTLRVHVGRRDHARAELDLAQRDLFAAVKQARATGVPQRDVEAITGLSRQRVWQIVNDTR